MIAVRWYPRYGLSYRDAEELLAERGAEVDHVTVYRWVQRFTPLHRRRAPVPTLPWETAVRRSPSSHSPSDLGTTSDDAMHPFSPKQQTRSAHRMLRRRLKNQDQTAHRHERALVRSRGVSGMRTAALPQRRKTGLAHRRNIMPRSGTWHVLSGDTHHLLALHTSR